MKTIMPHIVFLFLYAGFCRAHLSDTSVIRKHLVALTKTGEFRTHDNIDQLNKTAGFIESVFKNYSDSVSVQVFKVNELSYKNIICSFGAGNKKRIIVGAHYDVCGLQEELMTMPAE